MSQKNYYYYIVMTMRMLGVYIMKGMEESERESV